VTDFAGRLRTHAFDAGTVANEVIHPDDISVTFGGEYHGKYFVGEIEIMPWQISAASTQ
jgi:hypothetical protein